MSYPLGLGAFHTLSVGPVAYRVIQGSNVFTEPSVTRLTIIPQNTSGTAAGQNLDTSSRFGDARETTEVLLKAISFNAQFILNKFSTSTPLPVEVAHKVGVKICLVRTELPITTVQTDSHFFNAPYAAGSSTLRDLIPQRWKEYQIVKRWDFSLSQRRTALMYDAVVPNCYSETYMSEKKIKFYHKFPKPLKVTYTNSGGDQVDGPNYFLIIGSWRTDTPLPVPMLSPAASWDPAITLVGASSVYYTDRD